ncbi:MAG: hypothetical protein ABI992_10720 [Chthoniobacterales bacterium]
MTIPFLGFLKKKPPIPRVIPPPLEKASEDRMSKTVNPNSTRAVGPNDSFERPIEPPPSLGRATISFGGQTQMGRSDDLPPAVALALEPRVERTISVELTDVLSQMPAGMIRALEPEHAARHILLKASEVERGMASGRPTVAAWTVFQQVPEIFLKKLTPEDTLLLQLPFQKVLKQFGKLQVRSDQNQENVVPQLETPFLQVTLEDDIRFGTVTAQPKETSSSITPGRIELATAESLAAAQPEATATDKFVPPAMNFPGPKVSPPVAKGPVQVRPAPTRSAPPPVDNGAPVPTPIPFDFSPKGTDAPAIEQVPALASRGPSVPTSVPAAPAGPPTRIPFKITAETATPPEAAPKGEPWLTRDNFVGEPAPAFAIFEPAPAEDATTIALLLKPILQSVLPLQLTREIGGVPERAMIEIPCALLMPQLASGRVSLPPEIFAKYLPEAYRDLFDPTGSEAIVSLPLPEILKNLPGAALQMRGDQVEQEQGENFATPFSAKAAEDAERFKVPAAAVARSTSPAPAAAAAPAAEPAMPKASAKPTVEAVAPVVKLEEKTAAPKAKTASPKVDANPDKPVAATPSRTALQSALETDEELDAKSVVTHVAKIAGIQTCAIMFSDGLSLAGNLPEQFEADGLCAMAPSFFQRVGTHMAETKLGSLGAMTLFCEEAAVTFFMQDNLCLAAVHEKKELSAEVRERLARVLLELSRKYSHPA